MSVASPELVYFRLGFLDLYVGVGRGFGLSGARSVRPSSRSFQMRKGTIFHWAVFVFQGVPEEPGMEELTSYSLSISES